MWLFTDTGMYSVVAVDEGRDKPWGQAEPGTRLMVRSRSREQIEALKLHPELAEAVIYESSYSDYRYRLVVDKATWQAA